MNDTTTIEAINWETADFDALLPPVLAGRDEIFAPEIYDALLIPVNDREPQKVRNRIAASMRRLGWERKSVKRGTRVVDPWVLVKRDEAGATQPPNGPTIELPTANFDLIEAIASSSALQRGAISAEEFVMCSVVTTALQIARTPRRKTQSELAVVGALKLLVSKEGRFAVRVVADMLQRERSEARATRPAQTALPESPSSRPPRRFPVGE